MKKLITKYNLKWYSISLFQEPKGYFLEVNHMLDQIERIKFSELNTAFTCYNALVKEYSEKEKGKTA